MILMELERAHGLEDRRVRQEEHAAVVIQRFYRAQRGIRQQRLEHAAVVLQSHIRRFLAMRRYERLRHMYTSGRPIDEQALREGAEADQKEAEEFLRAVIGNPEKLEALDREQKLQKIYRRSEDRAATKIQRFYRSQRQQKLDKAAIVLQSHIRRFLAVRRYNRMKTARLEHIQPRMAVEIRVTPPAEDLPTSTESRLIPDAEVEEAAKKIQKFYRLHRNDMHRRLNQAATVIQSYIRRYLAMKRVERMRLAIEAEKNAATAHSDMTPEKAATKIQSVWRGFATRRRLSNTDPLQAQDPNRPNSST
ncbi:unnamed protein product [Bursaphelenchus xylophilus]|nr:unnamed protein product [Bursaphelenchus xylophilus]CAG9119247.1 unnamed protein product [Bursaphelenchus xylophilus]